MKTKNDTFMGYPRKIDFDAIERKRIAKEKKERLSVLKSLLKKRFLRTTYPNISEYVLLEISPSSDYVLLMNSNGKKEWMKSSELRPIEIIGLYKKKIKK